jgi:adenylate cyclase
MRFLPHGLFWILVLCASAGAGVLYGVLFDRGSPAVGAIFGLCVSLPLLAFERGILLGALQRWIRALSGLGFIAAALLTYDILIAVGFAVGGTIVWALGLVRESWMETALLSPRVLLYALAVSAIIIFVIRVRDLIGREVFANLLIGRYRRPVREERVFLFIDLIGSTSFAEEFGDLRAQEFLRDLFATFAEPVRHYRGAIDDYIGDAAIITWPLGRGVERARCVRCLFDILDRIDAGAEQWMQRYGMVPRLRAALHGGPVITAEIGLDRRKISYFGDTVNTTARLEALCRTLGAPILISGDLLARLPQLPENVASADLGIHAVRGRDQPLSVSSLNRRKVDAHQLAHPQRRGWRLPPILARLASRQSTWS